MSKEKEVWKPATNCFGMYEVSNLGRVKSIRKLKNGTKKKKILKPQLKNGYYIVYTNVWGKRKGSKIHQLVFTTFVDNTFITFNNNLVIDHIDENKLNNRVSNLQLLTSAENTKKHHALLRK